MEVNMKKVLGLVFLLVFISNSGFAALINSDFETGNLNGWEIIKSYQSTTIDTRQYDVTGDGLTSWASRFFYTGYGDNGISQNLITETGVLSVELDIAIRFQSVSGHSSTVRLFVDDVEIYTINSGYYWNGEIRRYSISELINVDAGSHTLKLVADSPGNPKYFSYYSDNWQTNFASVPVPAAVWLFGSGLICLVGIRAKGDRLI